MLIVRRVVFSFIVVFWTVMNVWLWRSEIGGDDPFGATIPPDLVWQKILTAPDDSALEILHHGKKIGHCRWRANVGEELSVGKIGSEDTDLEGRIKRLSGYTIDIEGNLLLEELLGRLRFELHSSFHTNHSWKQITARVSARPQVWEFEADALSEKVVFRAQDDESQSERQFSFADLKDPQRLLGQFGSALPLGLMALPGALPSQTQLSLGLAWQARKDWFDVGHSRMRAYRLEARLLDRFRAVVIVSRVGEILRVELPNEIVLMNDAFVAL